MSLAEKRGANLIGFFKVSRDPQKIQTDDLSQLWGELKLPAVIPDTYST
jgi:hypothetical protein